MLIYNTTYHVEEGQEKYFLTWMQEFYLPEVVGDAGIYFDPFNVDDIKEAIKKMLTDEKLREESVLKNPEQVRKFTWKKSSDIITECYRKAVR